MSTFQLASRRVFLPSCRRTNVVQSVSRRTMMAFEDHARLRVSSMTWPRLSEIYLLTMKTCDTSRVVKKRTIEFSIETKLSFRSLHISPNFVWFWHHRVIKNTTGQVRRRALLEGARKDVGWEVKSPASPRRAPSQWEPLWTCGRTCQERVCQHFGKDGRFGLGGRTGESRHDST